MTASPDTAPAAPAKSTFLEAVAVYFQPRVLIVLFLGFSSGLPLALSGTTLLIWLRESGLDLGIIGLFALAGTPYTVKFLWAPLTDALDAPLLSRRLGRRRGGRGGVGRRRHTHVSLSFRGAAGGREPGIHNPGAAEYRFRARRFAASRNDIN